MENPSPLLTLPLELRLEIYEYALADFALAMRRTGSVGVNSVVPYHSTSHKALNLLQVSKQVRAEALPVLWTIPKVLAFKMHFIEGMETLPPLTPKLLSSIRVVMFNSRSGSRELLERLPNLDAIAVCREALTCAMGHGVKSSPNQSIAELRERLISHIQASNFVTGLSQKWLLHYYYRSKDRAKVWCRVIATSGDPIAAHPCRRHHHSTPAELSFHLRQAVWVDLDQRGNPEKWKWCVPTKHGCNSRFQISGYNPPLEQDADKESLAMVCRWWGRDEATGGDDYTFPPQVDRQDGALSS